VFGWWREERERKVEGMGGIYVWTLGVPYATGFLVRSLLKSGVRVYREIRAILMAVTLPFNLYPLQPPAYILVCILMTG